MSELGWIGSIPRCQKLTQSSQTFPLAQLSDYNRCSKYIFAEGEFKELISPLRLLGIHSHSTHVPFRASFLVHIISCHSQSVASPLPNENRNRNQSMAANTCNRQRHQLVDVDRQNKQEHTITYMDVHMYVLRWAYKCGFAVYWLAACQNKRAKKQRNQKLPKWKVEVNKESTDPMKKRSKRMCKREIYFRMKTLQWRNYNGESVDSKWLLDNTRNMAKYKSAP